MRNFRRYPSPPKTYYVDNTGGSDSSRGTAPDIAWRTLTKINTSTFKGGDKILLKDGEDWTSTTGIVFPSSGKPGRPIYIGHYGGGALPIINKTNGYGINTNTQNYLVVDGIRGTQGTRNIYVNDSHHIEIRNCHLKASVMDESSISCGGSADYLTHDILVEGCYISGTPGWGITAGDFVVQRLTVRNCNIMSIGNTTGSVGHHSIYTTNAKELLVEDCTIDFTLNHSIVLKALVGKTCSGTFRRNKLSRHGQGSANVEVGIGIVLDGAEWAIVNNNDIRDGSTAAGGGGIKVSQSASTTHSNNVEIYNNTIVRHYHGISISDGDVGFIVKNNIVMQDFAWAAANSRVPLNWDGTIDCTNNNFNNNLWWFKNGAGSKDPIQEAGVQMTFAAFKLKTGSPEANGLSVNPLLTTEYTDLHLQAGSTARDAGANIGANSATDVEQVPLDSVPNMGCYQT